MDVDVEKSSNETQNRRANGQKDKRTKRLMFEWDKVSEWHNMPNRTKSRMGNSENRTKGGMGQKVQRKK